MPGTLPKLPGTLRPVMVQIAREMANSVGKNLIDGGRPVKWPARRDGQASHLMGKTLMLAGSMRQTATETEAILGMGRGVPYAAIHNFGGAIKHPGSNKLQSFRIGEKWITTTHTRPHLIPMPKRQYMMFQEGDETRYAEMIRAYIMDFGMNNKTVVP